MRKIAGLIGLLFITKMAYGFTIYPVTIKYHLWDDCFLFTTAFYHDNSTPSDRTDDYVVGIHLVMRCGGSDFNPFGDNLSGGVQNIEFDKDFLLNPFLKGYELDNETLKKIGFDTPVWFTDYVKKQNSLLEETKDSELTPVEFRPEGFSNSHPGSSVKVIPIQFRKDQ